MPFKRLAPIAAATLAVVSPAAAQQAAPAGGNSEQFMFHLEGVTVDQARADIDYCVSLAKPARAPRDGGAYEGGLIGNLIDDAFADTDRRRMRNAIMRRCMALHGYARYAVSREDWPALVDGGDMVLNRKGETDVRTSMRFAILAAGPKPATRRLDP